MCNKADAHRSFELQAPLVSYELILTGPTDKEHLRQRVVQPTVLPTVQTTVQFVPAIATNQTQRSHSQLLMNQA